MSPKAMAQVLGVGRAIVGTALLVAPGRAAAGWIGTETAQQGGTQVMIRALGIRDLIMGVITLHTLNHPEVGPRWLRLGVVADVVDFSATVAARRELPAAGATLSAAVAGGAAVVGAVLASKLSE
jgi:hypothetical protein